MKVTLQKASSLFRQFPALWVPVIVAAGISYGVTSLLHLLTHRLTLALITQHSVFGGTPTYDLSHSAVVKAALYLAPIVWSGKFLVIGIFSAALVITGRRVLAITSSSLAETRRPALLPLLRLSAKVLAVYAFLILLSFGTFRLFPHVFYRRSTAFYEVFVTELLLVIVIELLLGLCVAPMALHFLAYALRRSVPARAVRAGCGFAVITVVIRMAFSLLAHRVEHLLFAAWPYMAQAATQTVLVAGAVFAALPFAPLFVCLTLLLDVESPTQASLEITEPTPVEP